jgi:serine phosphatase RsbU (regulator of sigma subunit)
MTESVPRILLVEDDEADALLVRECLFDAGARQADVRWVRTVMDGRLALLEQAPECVLLDLGLPDAEGLSAVHLLVAEAAGTPVIVLTGRNDRGTGDEAVAAGAQDYLVKDGITPDLLARAVRYAVERKRAQQTELQLRAEKHQSAENARLERGLLPNPQLRSDLVTCTTYYQPGRNLAVLGGDFFDVVETDDGRIRAVIGDVMGHGPDEAAIGVHLRVAWRSLVLAGVRDEDVLANLARLLHAETGGLRGFVTACDVTISPDRTVTVRVAGHPAPLVCSASGASYLAAEVGPPLGYETLAAGPGRWAATGGWPVTHARLEPATTLLLYTDGLLEAYRTSSNCGSVGIDELVAATAAAARAGAPASTWIPSLVGGAPARSADDTAVVVLTLRPHCR